MDAAEVNTTFNFPACLRSFNVITRPIGKTIWGNYELGNGVLGIPWCITSPMLLIDCLIIPRFVISRWRCALFLIRLPRNESRAQRAQPSYNSIYENRRDFNQRETPLINAPQAATVLLQRARFVSTLKNWVADIIPGRIEKRKEQRRKETRVTGEGYNIRSEFVRVYEISLRLFYSWRLKHKCRIKEVGDENERKLDDFPLRRNLWWHTDEKQFEHCRTEKSNERKSEE